MRNKQAIAVAGAAALLASTTAAPSASAATRTVLNLGLNESAGAQVAGDSSGMRHNGRIGAHVVMNGVYAHFDRHPQGEAVSFGNEHLITIPDAADGSLDPGAGNFSVEVRYRTGESFGNLLQKGQATDPGGQVKFQQPKGKLTCMFKTPQGTATAGSGTRLLNDNRWHTVRCERTPTSVTMYVDGVRTGRSSNSTGTLNNTKPWTIGGKPDCSSTNVSCDYFAGDVNYVKMTKG